MIDSLDYVDVGLRIRRIRLESGISQEQLAERCSLTPSYVSKVETGASKGRLETYYKIAEALNVSIDSFLAPKLKNSPDKNFINLYLNLTKDQKELLYAIMNNLDNFEIHKK